MTDEQINVRMEIGDLVLMCLLVRECYPGQPERLAPFKKRLRASIAYGRALADQRNAALRDGEESEPESDDDETGVSK